MAWGVVSLLTSVVKDYTGILVARFFLGVVEAPFFCGVIFYLSCWYTRKELSLRNNIVVAGAIFSGAFGSVIAAGILSGLNNVRGLHAWQWVCRHPCRAEFLSSG
jgi:MFS family permease